MNRYHGKSKSAELSGTYSLNLFYVKLTRIVWLIGVGTAFFISPTVSEAANPITSLYTSIELSKCWTPPAPLGDIYHAKELGIQECQAPEGLRLFVVSSNERSWIDLLWQDVMWSTEEQVVHKNQFGYFPNISGSSVIEWRLEKDKPIGLIFRVVTQDPSRMSLSLGQSNTSRLFVLSFHNGSVCWRGTTETNETARKLADSEAPCAEKLPSRK